MPKAKGHHVGNKLSAASVRNASEPGLYADGHGLYLQVSSFETKAWVFRYMMDGGGRKMGLGPLHTVSLAEARKRAAEARLKVLRRRRSDREQEGEACACQARSREGDHF